MTEWISAAEAARQLGVKQATLYSYVSRGVLTRRRGTGGKGSLFDAARSGSWPGAGGPAAARADRAGHRVRADRDHR